MLQVSWRSEIITIFNNNFVYCQAGFLKPFMISFCNMAWVAGWFSLREIAKCTSVFHLICLQKYNKVLTELWKDKNTKENMKETKEHKISNTLYRGLSVVPKTDGEIYVSISIGEYIITFTCFLHCAKKRSCCWKYRKSGYHLKNHYWKNIYTKVVENARKFFQSALITPRGFLEKRTSIFLK